MPTEFVVIDKGKNDSWRYAQILKENPHTLFNQVFTSFRKAEAALNGCDNGIIVGTEDLPNHTPYLLNDICDYLVKLRETVNTFPPNCRESIRQALPSPMDLINRIESWKSTAKYSTSSEKIM